MELLLYGLELAALLWQIPLICDGKSLFLPHFYPQNLLVESATKPRKLEFVQLTVMDDNLSRFCVASKPHDVCLLTVLVNGM